MGDSYRIRTEIGVNKTINVDLEQDFNFLEILSLKIQQEDVYNKSCSNYGVVVGRITANNGYGIPNAKVSVFVPIDETDKQNPQITAIYPYTTLQDKNDDGYRYNLLPYEPSYSNHSPTGTFPSRMDALTNPVAIEIYDKYYKFTVKTNESGDYMIFGVPLGVQVVFLDLDLSDIGEFSLTPQDLIRMGRATEAQISGNKFKSSNNLNSLPQIVSLSKSIEVSPLWGDPDICQIAINRVDFDLRDDANIDIQPTAVFMGSVISSIDTKPLKVFCKPSTEMGNLCNLVAGPGEILAIRQTIYQDEYGRPILEQYNFDGGNNVIQPDGSWLVDLPMNLDYVSINEFGEKVFSNDPTIGIPTNAKYRFKVKWKQPNDLGQLIKRGYFLVPNIRENGWTSSYSDPRLSSNPQLYQEFIQSYAFSLDWADYGNTGTTIGRKIIQSAIDCEDRFYKFAYNKVYTISQLIDLYHKGTNRGRFIGIKQITDTSCDSTNYKFPTNDGTRNFDIIFNLFNFFLAINFLIIISLIPVLHILAIIFPLFKLLYVFVYSIIAWLIYGICKLIDAIPGVNPRCNKPQSIGELWSSLKNPFVKLKLPIITYPDCEICNCKSENIDGEVGTAYQFALAAQQNSSVSCTIDTQSSVGFSNVSNEQYCADDPFLFSGGLTGTPCSWIVNEEVNCAATFAPVVQELLAGNGRNYYYKRTPASLIGNCGQADVQAHSQDLTLAERLNLFNLKGKYFNTLSSQGGGENQIQVKINPTLNTGANQVHYDNVIALIVDNGCAETFTTGKIISFNAPDLSKDKNITGATSNTYLNAEGDEVVTNATIGSAYQQGLSQITVKYADPNNPNAPAIPVQYLVDQSAAESDILVPNSAGVITSTTFESQAISAANGGSSLYTNVSAYTATNGVNATFDVTVVNGQVTNVTINNPGYGYDVGTYLLIIGSQIGGTDNLDDVNINIDGVQSKQFYKGIVQKFPTDIEYFQVITATTFGNFCNLNPQVPIGQYNDSGRANFNSLRYRYTDNFMTIWSERYGDIIDGSSDFYTFFYVTDDTYRPIYTMPEQKDFYVVFLMRGVDPNSARQEMDIDMSKLFGKPYGSGPKVRANYKLNIPVQPGLVLPRHNQINLNTDTSQGQSIFFDSYIYDTPSSFISYSTNLVANYSSLDTSILNTFQVDTNSATSKLAGKATGFPNVQTGYLCVNNAANIFGRTKYVGYILGNERTQPVNAGAYSNGGFYYGIDNPNYLNILSEGVQKQHRGYYDQEYIEGGSYFYLQPTPYSMNGSTFGRILPEGFVYFSPAYSTGTTTTTFVQGTKKVVMRSDRLPTSTNRNDVQGNNTFMLHQNNQFAINSYTDEGVSTYTNPSYSSGGISGDLIEDEPSQFEASLTNTFSCEGLVPLKCYSGSGLSFGVFPTGNECYEKPSIVSNGCYVFVNVPILRLFRDFQQLGEWKSRFKVNMAACRGVFGHNFVNNWINGTLFAFPIKNKRLFNTDPTTGAFNQPFNKYCKDVVMLHPITNNFFYRSSPYNASSDKFVGMVPNNPTHRNRVQLLFPTTIMDLGPRDSFAAELTLSENYYGYNMENMNSTSYQDISNILNLFIISRQISSSFLQQLFGVGDASVDTFFSRPKQRFDGDYAQMISINSELGVDGFDFELYDFSTSGSTSQNTFFLGDELIGIFFSSDTQVRDYVSPRRIIRNDNTVPGQYDNLPIFSQDVPMYKWNIKTRNQSNSIFGTQLNDWVTTSSEIQKFKYQSMDRINILSNYYMGQTNIPEYLKGYIYNVQSVNGTVGFQPYLAGQLLNPGPNYTVGAPFHFYFGLIRGNSALDKFNVKYLGVETI